MTKSGSNEFRGSVFGNFAPGALATRGTEVRQETGTISGRESLWNLGDIGAELGGPLIRDKLWFYVGIAPSFTRYQIERNLNVRVPDENGEPQVDEDDFTRTQPIEGTQQHFFAEQRSLQYIGKLTYHVSTNHTVALSVVGTPFSSGGPGRFSLLPDNGAPEITVIVGAPEALSTLRGRNGLDLGLKTSSSFFNKHLLLDATLGWHLRAAPCVPRMARGRAANISRRMRCTTGTRYSSSHAAPLDAGPGSTGSIPAWPSHTS
ncbi:hypothetical protein D187_009946 [Cystobacter fuscus DSM 2262]|uniref:TonB-dependent transporter Oar-like beta-barrel domain-containing protein n=1 Tax=Cystobacter fuscus (strain ATCC 25194 / DSM 2262 / NBRC 100088 / M29) TaxID=1242864 RepID=S9QZE6_CYSF2|nr:hypothetical protein D187_009946 [Cystobacter fuscus DSM 2262]